MKGYVRNESMVETKRKYAKDYDGCMWGGIFDFKYPDSIYGR